MPSTLRVNGQVGNNDIVLKNTQACKLTSLRTVSGDEEVPVCPYLISMSHTSYQTYMEFAARSELIESNREMNLAFYQ